MLFLVKMDRILGIVCISCLLQISLGQKDGLRGPAKVETNPKYSNSYIPAAMQIMAYQTELMKYVIKPPPGTTTTTTTTLRPTPTHKPAVYAPPKPLGPSAYFSKVNVYGEYVQRQQEPSGPNYFDRYYPLIQPETADQGRSFPTYLPPAEMGEARTLQNDDNIYDFVEQYLGKSYGEVLRLANRIDPDFTSKDEDAQVLDFSKNFEERNSEYRYELLRQKRVPPTKAYVTLLSLYDILNKEAKKLMLNKFNGYSLTVINDLVSFSSSTSSYQLRSVLNKIIEKGNTRQADLIQRIKTLIADLDQEGSYINAAIKDIPPLAFSH